MDENSEEGAAEPKTCLLVEDDCGGSEEQVGRPARHFFAISKKFMIVRSCSTASARLAQSDRASDF